MKLELDVASIHSKADFHKAVKIASGISFYGENLDALWDLLTGLVERPVSITWKNAKLSKISMDGDFDNIVKVIFAAVLYYENDEFTFELSNS
jgi:ribonuclease inhibitor